MRALLDVNVLIALLDAKHLHHRRATDWLASRIDHGRASSPITQNGCIRILSQPAYPNPVTAAQAAERLTEATRHPSHTFWADSVSLLDPGHLAWTRILTSQHVTDVYLLALAVRHGGCFVTLDRGIPLDAVNGAIPDHLVMIP